MGDAMKDDVMKDRTEQLVDHIMKKCLWQFHSRAWDRTRQNEGILTRTKQLLCDEPVDISTPDARCYWVDAVCLADAFRARFAWLADMSKDDIAVLMQGLHERIEYLTVTGSLNLELTDQKY